MENLNLFFYSQLIILVVSVLFLLIAFCGKQRKSKVLLLICVPMALSNSLSVGIALEIFRKNLVESDGVLTNSYFLWDNLEWWLREIGMIASLFYVLASILRLFGKETLSLLPRGGVQQLGYNNGLGLSFLSRVCIAFMTVVCLCLFVGQFKQLLWFVVVVLLTSVVQLFLCAFRSSQIKICWLELILGIIQAVSLLVYCKTFSWFIWLIVPCRCWRGTS